MEQQYMDYKTLQFILHEVNNIGELLEFERFKDYDMESINLLLNSTKDYADREMFPVFREMDEDPAEYVDGKIKVHPKVKEMMAHCAEMGLIASTFDYEDGGFQMPYTLDIAAGYIQEAANNYLTAYPGLTRGAAELIMHFGSQELKDTYVPKMFAGEWGGTMCLTEPNAGSSLSDLVTKAVPTEEGHYNITGQKIFITAGDHPYCDNFVHLLLARIEGAPMGTKGISLFVVPKFRPENGELVSNDVITAADFPKLGQKGICTTHLIFGEKSNCRGYLVGEANKGLKYMFRMMNGARIAVGRGGAAISMAAYQASLKYANERPQGRRIASGGVKNVEEDQTLIINHPDVRRMLLLQKCIAEGSLNLVMKASKYADMAAYHPDEEVRGKYHLLLELLTPVVKTYPSEMGIVSITNGLQVLGGAGFISEYVLQQYYRDIRIFTIYEGTTGIQSLDLLGRKIPMKGGKGLQLLMAEIQGTLAEAGKFEDLQPYAKQLGERLGLAQKVLQFLSGFAFKGDFERYLSDATPFMEFFGKIVIGWLWLEMAAKAKQEQLVGNENYSNEFLQAKVHAMRFYFKYELTKTTSLAEIIMHDEVLTIPNEEKVLF